MPDTLTPIFDTRAAVASFERAARAGLAAEAAEYRAEIRQHAADLASILGWLKECGVAMQPLSEAAALLVDALVDADHMHVRTLDEADDARAWDVADFSALRDVVRGIR